MIYTDEMKIKLIELTTHEFDGDNDADYVRDMLAILNRVPVGTDFDASDDFGDQDEEDMIDTDRIILALDYFYGTQNPF